MDFLIKAAILLAVCWGVVQILPYVALLLLA